jgi:hypothetical protein
MILMTTYKTIRTALLISLSAATLCGFARLAMGQSDQDLVEVARSVIKADRKAVVVASMNLTEDESKAFWPLYHEYRAKMDQVADEQIKLVLEYAKLYPSVSDDRATEMLDAYMNLQRAQVAKRTEYLKKFRKALPPAKALRFAQIETRLDLLVQLQLAASIPLVPTGGQDSRTQQP